ncbi:hypothetical protein DICPUDRAFT_85457 [Dictyostelium purpureum]|uniref:Uncharacterized protein n=1 Tax=Dictyostelium purpureum TaxID=5786 RepID=F1A5S8_DICPU|nr:uncharacterized protein DICPUDRAFT_85457 [Dictyostelium purpureum]EGC28451.1 hypothetical protein DICPUDRAFT_85457 [Dictyostelium purpureum]|eukprot:XP_003295022.1 hypothetical protein DICPUDRAFT_85457 [Dictyostelium purpureum]
MIEQTPKREQLHMFDLLECAYSLDNIEAYNSNNYTTVALAFSLKNSKSNNNTTTAAPESTTFILRNSNKKKKKKFDNDEKLNRERKERIDKERIEKEKLLKHPPKNLNLQSRAGLP